MKCSRRCAPTPLTSSRTVAGKVRTKYAAKLKFLADESFDEGSKIVANLLRGAPKVAQEIWASE